MTTSEELTRVHIDKLLSACDWFVRISHDMTAQTVLETKAAAAF